MKLNWLKLDNNLDNDSRVVCILNTRQGDVIMFCYIRLLVLAARCNCCGALYVTEGLKIISSSWATPKQF